MNKLSLLLFSISSKSKREEERDRLWRNGPEFKIETSHTASKILLSWLFLDPFHSLPPLLLLFPSLLFPQALFVHHCLLLCLRKEKKNKKKKMNTTVFLLFTTFFVICLRASHNTLLSLSSMILHSYRTFTSHLSIFIRDKFPLSHHFFRWRWLWWWCWSEITLSTLLNQSINFHLQDVFFFSFYFQHKETVVADTWQSCWSHSFFSLTLPAQEEWHHDNQN